MSAFYVHWLSRLILWGYDLLYHSFSWLYDFTAWLVSAGKWNDWIRTAGNEVEIGPVIDLGCGKGILVHQMEEKGFFSIGLDESPQMLCYSRQFWESTSPPLVRGLGQTLPFRTASIKTVTATFPAPYIFFIETMNEIHRVLQPDGKLIILLTAEITGTSLHEKIIHFFTTLLGFNSLSKSFQEYLQKRFSESGFLVNTNWVQANNAKLFVIIGHPV